MNKEDFEKARAEIEEADRQAAMLFEKRMNAVKIIASYKKENGLDISDRKREEELTEKNCAYIENESIRNYYLDVFNDILRVSKDYQSSIISEKALPCNIVLKRGALSSLKEYLPSDKKALIVTDSGVPKQYARVVADTFESSVIYTFPQGEQSKTPETFLAICKVLLSDNFSRSDCIVAVGGGVVCGVAGFAAACYMRGIDFYAVPTTLLAQIDASVGGKTAVDFENVKNPIGAFHRPKTVIIDPNVLNTLPKRHISNGFAEAIKMGVTSDEKLFELFENPNPYDRIDEIIRRSLLVKTDIVRKDEKEQSLRRVLNFGHTIGHAIELSNSSDLLHGECVAIGMLLMCGDEIRERVKKAILNAGLECSAEYDRIKAAECLIHDKKANGKTVTVVTSRKIGSFEFKALSAQELKSLL